MFGPYQVCRVDSFTLAKYNICMSSIELKELEKKALNLNLEERELLANHLFQSVHYTEPNEIDSAWLCEVEDRYSEYLKNPTKCIPHKKVFDEIRSELEWI